MHSPSATTSNAQTPDDEDKIVQQLLAHCRAFLAKKTSAEDSVKHLKAILQAKPANASLLFDVLVALQLEFDEERARKSERADEVHAFLSSVASELLPTDVLTLELNALGADEQQTKSKMVKSKTRMFYKQLKFNLLREESEGYAKLIAELFQSSVVFSGEGTEQLILTVEGLIGQFNLDPNRVVDIVLECFEQSPPNNAPQFIRLIKEFKMDKGDLRNILLLKFLFCQRNEHTPMSLYRVVSHLAQEGLVDIPMLFTLISPTRKELMEEYKSLTDLVKLRSNRAETISSNVAGLLASATESFPIASILNAANDSSMDQPSATPAISFSAATQCQLNEDRKLAGTRFDDSVLHKNQKLGLLCALLEHGDLAMAQKLLELLPEGFPFGVCPRIAMALANIIGFCIEPFYRLKASSNYECLANSSTGIRMKDSWERFTCHPKQVSDWQSLFDDVCPIAFKLGPYIGARHEVAIKLIRLLNTYYSDEEALKPVINETKVHKTIMSLCDAVLVPAASLLESNFAYCEELWQILSRFSYMDRYRIYHRWRTVHTERCWDLSIQKGKVFGMTRYIMKRLSKDTAKVMGRQLGKLCHTYPTIPLDYLVAKVQDFQNFIGPVVESIRFLSSLEFDVLSYCLIENLAAPEKQEFKISDISFSGWLQSLANFAAAIFKRYNIDFTGILQYIANQLKDTQSLDLIVLREIVTGISGVESNTDLTQEHLEALCGGDTLRGEAGYLQMTKLNRRSINRLREALLRNELFESLCILIGQQKQFIIYRDSKQYPLKLTTQMLDHCQETFVQFFDFLRTNLKPEEYARRMPSASILTSEFHLPIEAALCLTRPIYMHKIEMAYELAKKNGKENGKAKLDGPQKSSLYKDAFTSTLNALEEELMPVFPEAYWLDMTSRMHTIFWLLSVNDLLAPLTAYERGIDKCRKEMTDLQTNNETSSVRGATRRTAKDEERLKGLEQKLSDEMRRQTEHVKRIKEILVAEKDTFFASAPNRTSQMLRFLQSCVLPRVICSEVEAVYCAKLVETLHTIKTGYFQTIVFMDKIFNDITSILAGFSERETHCFGRYCSMLLDMTLRWHSSKAIFNEECEGYPGCVTKIRKKDRDETATADEFTYDYFRSICYKWQLRLNRSLGFMLQQNNYVLIRNALTLMTKILPNFPILRTNTMSIEKHVTAVRDNEKGKRNDLNLLAASYLVQLTKRNVKVWEPNEFADTRATTKSQAPPKMNGTSSASAARKAVTAPASDRPSSSSTVHSPRRPAEDGITPPTATPIKRSRPSVRSRGADRKRMTANGRIK
uniref:THO complex subunit 2 n=1 Tax=Globodera rostochiensis TaxID=31243 RepID=A0A914HDU3_GLORO